MPVVLCLIRCCFCLLHAAERTAAGAEDLSWVDGASVCVPGCVSDHLWSLWADFKNRWAYSEFWGAVCGGPIRSRPLTHGGGKNDNPQDVHAFAGPRRRLHDDVRRRREVQGKVLHVGAVVVLDAVDVDPARGGLIQELSHRWLGDELGDSLGSILGATKRSAGSNKCQQNRQQARWKQQIVSSALEHFLKKDLCQIDGVLWWFLSKFYFLK